MRYDGCSWIYCYRTRLTAILLGVKDDRAVITSRFLFRELTLATGSNGMALPHPAVFPPLANAKKY